MKLLLQGKHLLNVHVRTCCCALIEVNRCRILESRLLDLPRLVDVYPLASPNRADVRGLVASHSLSILASGLCKHLALADVPPSTVSVEE